jgi:hypothetical protein
MERVSPMTGTQSVARLEALAKLMDGAFVIPGTNIRMVLDGVPVAGDMSHRCRVCWASLGGEKAPLPASVISAMPGVAHPQASCLGSGKNRCRH